MFRIHLSIKGYVLLSILHLKLVNSQGREHKLNSEVFPLIYYFYFPNAPFPIDNKNIYIQ